MALVVGVCALLGVTGWNLVSPPQLVWGVFAAAGGVALGAAAVFLLPRTEWAAALGPLVVTASMAVSAAAVLYMGVTWMQAAAALVALLIVLSAVVPSMGLMLLPMRHLALSTQRSVTVSRTEAVAEVRNAAVAVTACRAGISVSMVAASIVIAGSWWGAALVACCAISLAVGVRNIYSRVDVLINTIAGFTALLVGAVVAVWAQPVLSLVLCGVMIVAVALLVLHAASPGRLHAGLDRALDIVYMLVTIAVIPLAMHIWGVF